MYIDVDNEISVVFYLVSIFPSVATQRVAIAATKVIVSVPQLLQLVPRICHVSKCFGSVTIHEHHIGATLVLHVTCSSGHSYIWYSSPQHLDKSGSGVFYKNILLAASVLFFGNAPDKIF